MNLADLTPEQVVKWAYAKAKEFQTIGDTISASLGLKPSNALITSAAQIQSDNTPPLQRVVDHLKTVRSARAKDIADKIGVTKEEVDAEIAKNPAVFKKLERGWIQLAGTTEPPPTLSQELDSF